MRSIALSLAVLFASPLAACVESADDLGTEEAELHGPLVAPSGPPQTMLLRFHGSPGARGSATLIRQDLVLTNKHVVDWTGPGTVFVQLGDAPVFEVDGYEVITKWQSPTADLAILQLACSFHPADILAAPLSRFEQGPLQGLERDPVELRPDLVVRHRLGHQAPGDDRAAQPGLRLGLDLVDHRGDR
jgi:hypothetical protein